MKADNEKTTASAKAAPQKRAGKAGELVIALAALCLLYLVCQKVYDKITTVPEPKAARITEESQSVYLGRTVVDIPKSAGLSGITIDFILADNGRETIIELTEETLQFWGTKDLSDAFRFERQFGAIGAEAEYLGDDEDVSEKLGHPARMMVRATRSTFFDNRILTSLGHKPQNDPSQEKLEILLNLKTNQFVMKFKSTEEITDANKKDAAYIDERKTALVNWVKYFLPHYHWTGENAKPADGRFSTRYGQIKLDDEFDSGVSFTAVFSKYFDDEGSSSSEAMYHNMHLRFKVLGSSLSAAYGSSERNVGGHQGKESQETTVIKPRFPNEFKIWEKKNAMIECQWKDDSPAPATYQAPHYEGIMLGFFDQNNLDKGAYFLGMWDYVLNSVRPVEEDRPAAPESVD